MPRILLLADIASEHTQKWALGLAEKGIEVGIFSFHRQKFNWFTGVQNITVLFQPSSDVSAESLLTKLTYIKHVFRLKRVIRKFNPDILHAHYATSYGLVARLSGFHPFFLSAWGTDVMRFPEQNDLNRKLLRKNFEKADVVCATSLTIKKYIHAILNREVEVIPFGVDIDKFKPDLSKRKKDKIVIGCVKSLVSIYRIDVLIKAFKKLISEGVNTNTELLIVGAGPEESSLKRLVSDLGINEHVRFTGKVPHEEVPSLFQSMNIVANLSEYESFGVSVIEAMACGCAVIVTDTGGLKEIVNSESLGIKVQVDNIEAAFNALKTLVENEELRNRLSEAGANHVKQLYSWNTNLEQMLTLYRAHIRHAELTGFHKPF